jgi:nucleoid-associated protein YgaU
VLDEPLKPGDYQIVLRATQPGMIVMNSVETAVVSVPEKPDGQVLALVEQPGAPSKLITAPAGTQEQNKPDDVAASSDAPKAGEQSAAAPADEPTTPPVALGDAIAVSVEAVEIDGRKIFVAGGAPAGSTVRIYANDLLLGDAKSSPEGRFLLEIERDLKVGDYIIRADVLSPNGSKVLARAAVPFEREPGESIAAVAPTEPQPAAPVAAQPTAPAAEQAKPAGQAAAPADLNAPKSQDQAASTPPPADGQTPADGRGAQASGSRVDRRRPATAVAATDPTQPPAADATAPKPAIGERRDYPAR